MEDQAPNLPTYEKPRQRVPAVIPESIPKPPSSLNKLMSKMLKPNLKRAFKAPINKRKRKVGFY